MEGGELLQFQTLEKISGVILIKGVSNYGDGKDKEKEKEWEATAAMAAATFTRERTDEM